MRYRHELASICGQHMKSANTRMKYPIVQSQLVLTISRAIDHLSSVAILYKTSIQTSVRWKQFTFKKKGIEKTDFAQDRTGDVLRVKQMP